VLLKRTERKGWSLLTLKHFLNQIDWPETLNLVKSGPAIIFGRKQVEVKLAVEEALDAVKNETMFHTITSKAIFTGSFVGNECQSAKHGTWCMMR